jgi:hypothetical protein
VLVVSAVYLVSGILFPAFAKSTASDQARVAWRLSAWVISAAAFAMHVGYERVRLRSSPVVTAVHASMAVALGAFALAIAAALHARTGTTPGHFPTIALAIWPVMTALPAFLVALAAASVIARARHST